MEFRAESIDHVDVLHLTGRLDLVSSSALKDQVRQRLQDRRNLIVLGCAALDFINSSGLGALISAMKDARLSNGRLVLCALRPFVDEIFEITELKKIIDVYPDVESAVASFAHKKVRV